MKEPLEHRPNIQSDRLKVLVGRKVAHMDWPHSPLHRLEKGGAYIVTCGTLRKEHFFRTPERLTLLRDSLFTLASQYDWKLQAWSIFSNHYHFVAMTASSGLLLPRFVGHLHTITAKAVNELDGREGRKVWFQYRDTLLTYERSYLARLNYVHNNPVKHGLVEVASKYPWCSASWFEQKAPASFYRTVMNMKTDQVNVPDDFIPEP